MDPSISIRMWSARGNEIRVACKGASGVIFSRVTISPGENRAGISRFLRDSTGDRRGVFCVSRWMRTVIWSNDRFIRIGDIRKERRSRMAGRNKTPPGEMKLYGETGNFTIAGDFTRAARLGFSLRREPRIRRSDLARFASRCAKFRIWRWDDQVSLDPIRRFFIAISLSMKRACSLRDNRDRVRVLVSRLAEDDAGTEGAGGILHPGTPAGGVKEGHARARPDRPVFHF